MGSSTTSMFDLKTANMVFDWNELHGKKLEIFVKTTKTIGGDQQFVYGKDDRGHVYLLSDVKLQLTIPRVEKQSVYDELEDIADELTGETLRDPRSGKYKTNPSISSNNSYQQQSRGFITPSDQQRQMDHLKAQRAKHNMNPDDVNKIMFGSVTDDQKETLVKHMAGNLGINNEEIEQFVKDMVDINK